MKILGTFNGADIVALPAPYTSLSRVELNQNDAVAIVTSIFTGQQQAQRWPGADSWSGTIEFPPLTQDLADEWSAWSGQLRGMTNCFLMGDPMKTAPRGSGKGQPVVNSTLVGSQTTGGPDGGTQVVIAVAVPNQAMDTSLVTRGWLPNSVRLLVPGDYLQVGYRLHEVLNVVNSDATGNATIHIWPSIREAPADGDPIILHNACGLFRLASNKRTRSVDAQTRLTRMSFNIQEFR